MGNRRKPFRGVAAIGFGFAAIVLTSCATDSTVPLRPPAPVIEASIVTTNIRNVLSATVSVRVRNADSVAVLFKPSNAISAADNMTPAVETVGDSAVLPVLGLIPARRYDVRPVAYGPGGTVVGDATEMITGALPPDLPEYTASGADPAPGYVVFAAGMYGVVIDNTGRVVWYHRFSNGPGLSFMAQPNGRYVTRPITPDPTDIEPWVEIDPLGNTTRTLSCALGLQARPHDLIAETDGSYWLMCDESRTMDLSAQGGLAAARVTGTTVQHISAGGTLLFRWSPFDHFAITDVAAAERAGPTVNWTHGNALEIDTDRNVIVSFRNLDEITKIDAVSGAVIWRMGGLRNEFTFIGAAMPAFSHQHGARIASAGQLILLDNIGNPGESRSERYIIDEASRTARLAHSYGSIPGAMTQIGGSVQSLPGGRTMVSFGTAGRVEEYDSAGRVTWRIEGNAGYVFRAQRITSLYAPGAGTSR